MRTNDKIRDIIVNSSYDYDIKVEMVLDQLEMLNPGQKVTVADARELTSKLTSKINRINDLTRRKQQCYDAMNYITADWWKDHSAFAMYAMFRVVEKPSELRRAQLRIMQRNYTELYNEAMQMNTEMSELGFDSDTPPDWDSKVGSLQTSGVAMMILFYAIMVFGFWLAFKFMWWWNFQIW